LIDVEDMARAIAWALRRPASLGGQCLAVNAGHNAWNYQVRDLAAAVAAAVPGTRVSVNSDAPPDRRSYKVDFSLFRELAPDHVPRVTLEQSIARLRDGLTAMGFADRTFRSSGYMRLKMLERHIAEGRLGPDLRLRTP
jgi:nucleoside-diphosphate-sugar epimerase